MKRLVVAMLLTFGCSNDEPAMPELAFSLDETQYWQDRRELPVLGAGWILVTNNFDDTVSILDYSKVGTDELREIARVPVGFNPVEREGPHHLAPDPSGDYYYVGISNFVPGSGSGPHGTHGSGTADGYALKIRAADQLQVGAARVDPSPGDIRLTPDGRALLVSHFDLARIAADPNDGDATLAIVEPAAMTVRAKVPLCPAAHGIAVAPDSGAAYVSCLSDEVARVDLLAPEHPVVRVPVLPEPGTVSAPKCYPYAMTISPAGDSVWVSCFRSGEVLRYDTASGVMDPAGRVLLPGPAVFGAFSLDGTRLYVPHQQIDGIAIIDVATATLVQDIAFTGEECVRPHVARLTDDETRLLVVCEGNTFDPGRLVVIDLASGAIEKNVSLGRFPDDLQVLRRAP